MESLYYRARALATAMIDLVSKPTIDWQPIDPRVKTLYVPSSDSSYVPDGDAIFATAFSTVPSVLEYPPAKGEKFYLLQHYEIYMGPKAVVDETWRAPLHKVAVSKWLMEVGEQLGCKEIAYVPNAIDQERYRLTRPIECRAPRIAMTFSKAAIKGAADGIEALQLARVKYPKIEAVFFGQTNIRPAIPKWIEYHSNPPQDFIIRNIYNGSSIFLSPSWSEGYALPPAEAAACGCAIVASDSGGIRDYVENGVTGLLSQPKDPRSLAENLCLVLGDDDLRLRLALAANEAVAALSWERSTALLENFLKSSIRQKKMAASGSLVGTQ
jgi:glycosyltransferase involved in cell wall biosynthesis